MKTRMKISIIVGTRPNLIKISPLAKLIANDKDLELQLIDTGQHYDYELDRVFIDQLGIPEPIFLEVGSGLPGEQTGTALIKIEQEMVKFKPDMAVVIGDTNSTLAGALAASKLGVPLAHVEAGLRSFDRRMPEEKNRVAVDHLSDMLFAPTKTAVRNLQKEGISDDRIFLTHDISVDACLGNYEAAKRSEVLRELGVGEGEGFVLVTLHRPSNVDDKGTLSKILDALVEVSKAKEVMFPLHPRTRKMMKKFGIYDKYSNAIMFINPQGYFEFLKILGSAACVVTDSGGIQKEAMILKTPCITVRDTTEWPETLAAGANVLVGTSKIASEVKKRASEEFRESLRKIRNPFGDGKTSERILGILKAKPIDVKE